MTGTATPAGAELGWLLDELTTRVPMIRHAVMLSADGLAIATSERISREDGEHLAAVASGLHSLAKGATRHFGSGPVRQTMIEFDQGFLFVVAAGGGACLAVFSQAGADVGLVAYEMARLVRRVGEHLTAPPRSEPMRAAAHAEPAHQGRRAPDGRGAPPA